MKKLKNDYKYDIQYELNTRYIFDEIIKNKLNDNIYNDLINDNYDGCFLMKYDEMIVSPYDIDNFTKIIDEKFNGYKNIIKLKIIKSIDGVIYLVFLLNEDKYNTIEICSLYNDLIYILDGIRKREFNIFELKTLYISNCKLDNI